MNASDRQTRFEKLWCLGCIACRITGRIVFPAEIHHLNLGGKAGQKRRGDEFTIPLCTWHHRGEPRIGYTAGDMRNEFGPSLARESRAFRFTYGDDEKLLAEVNALI